MKKSFLLPLLFSSSILLADQGYEVYKNNCMMCHAELLTQKEAMATFDKLKAPPMNEVSTRLKDNIIIADKNEEVHKRVVIAFIKDYIKEPLIGDAMCRPGAVEKFGVMPAVTHLKEDEIQSVAEWIYERYEGIKF